MGAGRPHNSITPVWHNKAAIKVRIYRWLKWQDEVPGTKYDCAKMMEISRTTVIKWWDGMEWDGSKIDGFYKVMHWHDTHWEDLDYDRCARELNMPIDVVLLNVSTYKEMRGKYVYF